MRSEVPPLGRVVAMVALLVLGQVLIVVVGSLAPGIVRDGGAGVLLAPDSAGYLRLAADLGALSAEDVGTLGYVGLLAVGHRLGAAAGFVVVVQVLAALAAGFALYDLGCRRATPAAGWVAAAAYLLNPLVAQWTRYVLTEALFLAGLVLTLWAMLIANERDTPSWWVLWSIVLPLALLRQNAVVVPAAVGTYLLLVRRPRLWPAILGLMWFGLALIGLLSPAHASGGGGPDNTLAARTYVGEVIWGLPDERLDMPPPADPDDLRTAALVGYAVSHPLAVAELGARRIVWEVLQVRPHYPWTVNVLVGLVMTVMASMGALGWVTMRDRDLQVAVLSLGLPLLGLIAITWAVPEGRFGWGVLVLTLLWVAVGLVRLARSVTDGWFASA